MSQKVVYVRRPVMPRFDPDPDPDPLGIVTAAVLIIAVCLGGSTIVAPNLWNNLMTIINPKIGELEEERLKVQKDTINALIIVTAIAAIIILAYIFWRWNTQKKERAKAIKRYRNMRNKTMRMLRPR